MHELAVQRPQSLNALLQIPGIGLAKADRYGETLLALLAAPAGPKKYVRHIDILS